MHVLFHFGSAIACTALMGVGRWERGVSGVTATSAAMTCEVSEPGARRRLSRHRPAVQRIEPRVVCRVPLRYGKGRRPRQRALPFNRAGADCLGGRLQAVELSGYRFDSSTGSALSSWGSACAGS